MKCADCPYFWADTDEEGRPIDRPYCHYQWNDGYAPCEIEDEESEDEE